MTDRAPEDQAVHDRHPMIPQDTLDDCPHDRWTVRGDLFACDGCGVRAERIWKGWPTRPTDRCPRCACPVQDLEQHQPVCTGPQEPGDDL